MIANQARGGAHSDDGIPMMESLEHPRAASGLDDILDRAEVRMRAARAPIEARGAMGWDAAASDAELDRIVHLDEDEPDDLEDLYGQGANETQAARSIPESIPDSKGASRSGGVTLTFGGESLMANAGLFLGQFAMMGVGVVSALSGLRQVFTHGAQGAHVSAALGLMGVAAIGLAGGTLVQLLKHLASRQVKVDTNRVSVTHLDARVIKYAMSADDMVRAEVRRSFFGRSLNYGTLSLHSQSGKIMRIHRLAEPDRFLQAMAMQPQFAHVTMVRGAR